MSGAAGQEIEVKFLNVNHDEMRARLSAAGAKLVVPMRLMKRQMFDYPDSRFRATHQRLRLRDEGNGVVMINHKSRSEGKYAHEIETRIYSLEEMSEVLQAIGLVPNSYQESKRETWLIDNVEVVLDEWPWIKPYIEIEGPSESAIKSVADKLGFSWHDARFGSVDLVYMAEYPGMKETDSIGDVSSVQFDSPLPDYLRARKTDS